MNRTLQLTALLTFLIALLASAPALAAEIDKKAQAEARRTIMIPWSKDAKTSKLKLKDATRLVDLYLDFCRNRHQKRGKTGERFRLYASSSWSCDGKKVTFHVTGAGIEIENASIKVSKASKFLDSCFNNKFTEHVKVNNDDVDLLGIWASMLASEVAKEIDLYFADGGKGAPSKKSWGKSKERALKSLESAYKKSSPLKSQYTAAGKKGGERKALLEAIRIMAPADKAGKLIKGYYDDLNKEGLPVDASVAAASLVRCTGKEAIDYALSELKQTNDIPRMNKIMFALEAGCDSKILDRIIELLEKKNNDTQQRQNCIACMSRIAKGKAKSGKTALDGLLKFFKSATDKEAQLKYDSATALLRLKCKDEAPQSYIKELLAKLEKDSPTDKRIAYLKKLIGS